MGGDYDNRYSRCSSSSAPNITYITDLDLFFRTGDRKHLFDAYRNFMLTESAGFIQQVIDGGKTEIVKEFSEYEIESKLELRIEGNSAQKYKLEDIMDTFEFSPTPTARFIKDASNAESSGINHFFGTAEGEERFVLIDKYQKWYLKEKGPREEYHYGLPGEEYVFKRKETRKETTPLEVAQTILENYADGKTVYAGGISKNRVEAHLLQTITKRIYSLTVDYIETEKDQPIGMLQFEVEYAGRIKYWKIPDVDPEKAIVDDILAILKQIIFLHNGAQLPGGQQLHIAPSLTRKFDFVQVAQEKVPALVRGRKR